MTDFGDLDDQTQETSNARGQGDLCHAMVDSSNPLTSKTTETAVGPRKQAWKRASLHIVELLQR
jgi:hypothetical protein